MWTGSTEKVFHRRIHKLPILFEDNIPRVFDIGTWGRSSLVEVWRMWRAVAGTHQTPGMAFRNVSETSYLDLFLKRFGQII